MITRPSTPQVLRDIAEELNREIMPLLTQSTDQIRLFMITAVLGQCATRAGTEIALMAQETADAVRYAADVAAVTGSAAVQAAVDAAVPAEGLLLDEISAAYVRAGECLGTAIEAALDAGDADLIAQGEALLAARIANEQSMAGVASAGR